MKQTAVEWFFEQLTEVDYNCINKTFLQNNNSLAGYRLRELFEQAKEMEKQRTISFALLCMLSKQDVHINLRNDLVRKYNETYGGKDGK
jgi:hypothetical protein